MTAIICFNSSIQGAVFLADSRLSYPEDKSELFETTAKSLGSGRLVDPRIRANTSESFAKPGIVAKRHGNIVRCTLAGYFRLP